MEGDLSTILDLIWNLAYRSEIEFLQNGEDYGIGAILSWTKMVIQDYPVQFYDFKNSVSDGMLFNAIIHSFNPDLFSFGKLLPVRFFLPLLFQLNFKISFFFFFSKIN